MLCSIQDSLPFRSSSALRSRLCLKASRQGHLLHHQISPVPDIPQNLFTPQNVAIDQGINLRVVPTSQDSLGRSYCHQNRPQQFFSFYFSPNLSKSDVDATTDSQIHRHLDIQRRPILCMGRLKNPVKLGNSSLIARDPPTLASQGNLNHPPPKKLKIF